MDKPQKREVLALPSVTLTIPAGEALSGGVNITGTLQQIGMPPDWTNALLTFQLSPDDGVTWFDLVNPDDNSEVMFNITPGSIVRVAPGSALDNKTWLRFRSGKRGYPVAQQADRTFALLVV